MLPACGQAYRRQASSATNKLGRPYIETVHNRIPIEIMRAAQVAGFARPA
jgi:hypothetical protein